MSAAAGRVPLVEAVGALHAARRDDEIVVTSMGTAREWMKLPPHPLDFVLVPSSMGQATALALGLALARPDRRVVVCSGDGSLLMNLGSLVTIAAAAPSNLTVLLFDNGVYEVTGAQPTPGRAAGVDFPAIARASGLRAVHHVTDLDAWRRDLRAMLDATGPTFVALDVAPVPGAVGPRSPGPAGERAKRFMEALNT